MNSMRIYFAFWLSGLIAGVVLMERWRRRGEDYEAAVPNVSDVVDEPRQADVSKVPASGSNLVGLVVTGARLDAQSARQWFERRKASLSDNAR